MDGVNPKYVLRNWVAETAIRAVEDQDDAGPWTASSAWCGRRLKSMTATKLLPLRRRQRMCDLEVSCSS